VRSTGGVTLSAGVKRLAPVLVLGLALVTVGRSATQFAAMAKYNASSRVSALEQAATLDPGNYRVRLRLAQAYLSRGDCVHARTQARALQDLFPSAGEPRRILAVCSGR
jgi:Flp pilus assembly protein TadD